jgi:hypothetical protein
MNQDRYVFLVHHEEIQESIIHGREQFIGYENCFKDWTCEVTDIYSVLGGMDLGTWCLMKNPVRESLELYLEEFPCPEHVFTPGQSRERITAICEEWQCAVDRKRKPVPKDDLIHCPYCGSPAIRQNSSGNDIAQTYRRMQCDECGKKWDDFYRVDCRILRNPTETVRLVHPKEPVEFALGNMVRLDPALSQRYEVEAGAVDELKGFPIPREQDMRWAVLWGRGKVVEKTDPDQVGKAACLVEFAGTHRLFELWVNRSLLVRAA